MTPSTSKAGEEERETAIVKGRPEDHVQSTGNKENTVEETARLTLEAGIRFLLKRTCMSHII